MVVAIFASPRPCIAGDPTAQFIRLGDLPGGFFLSLAKSVSDDGSVVIGNSIGASNQEQPVRWTAASGMLPLSVPEGFSSQFSLRISGDGNVVAGVGDREGCDFPCSSALVWVGLRPLPLDHLLAPSSAVHACSHDGSVVVGADNLVPQSSIPGHVPGQAFAISRFRGVEHLPDLGSDMSLCTAFDVTANGQTVVGYGEDVSKTSGFPELYAVRWVYSDGQWDVEALPHLPNSSFLREARAVSPDGTFIVGINRTFEGDVPFLWRAEEGAGGTILALGTPPKDEPVGRASGVSADGRVVVGGWASGFTLWHEGPGTAFIWTPQRGMRNLQDALASDYGLALPGWDLFFASDITPDGRTIVGTGLNPEGFWEGWIVRLPAPCPADVTSDGAIDVDDLIAVILGFGPCPAPPQPCPPDINLSGSVDVDDLIAIILNWGRCA
jgi:uncharacterized membrane protein